MFWALLRQHVIARFNIRGLPLVTAFRLLSSSLVFPAESQQKEALIVALGAEYHRQNPHVYESPEIPQNLLYATMIINTILWNPNARRLGNRSSDAQRMFWDVIECADPRIRLKLSDAVVECINRDVRRRPIQGLDLTAADSLLSLQQPDSVTAELASEVQQHGSTDGSVQLDRSVQLLAAHQQLLVTDLGATFGVDGQVAPGTVFDTQSCLKLAPISASLN